MLAAEGGYVFDGAMLEGILPGGADVGCYVVLVPEVFKLVFKEKEDEDD